MGMKRLLDLAIAIVVLGCLAPLMALMIKRLNKQHLEALNKALAS